MARCTRSQSGSSAGTSASACDGERRLDSPGGRAVGQGQLRNCDGEETGVLRIGLECVGGGLSRLHARIELLGEIRVLLFGGAALAGDHHELRPGVFQRAIMFPLCLLGDLDLGQQFADLFAHRGLQGGRGFGRGTQKSLLVPMVLDGVAQHPTCFGFALSLLGEFAQGAFVLPKGVGKVGDRLPIVAQLSFDHRELAGDGR